MCGDEIVWNIKYKRGRGRKMLFLVNSTSSFFVENIGIIISSLITIVGFLVTYFLNRKNFIDELNKFKSNKSIELMQDVPHNLVQLLDLLKTNPSEAVQLQNNTLLTICAYGSKDAAIIAEQLMQNTYSGFKNPIDAIAYIALLISQVKFDITGYVVLPTSWLKIKIKDYSKSSENIIDSINKIIDDNKLNKSFKC